jgi:hypothetical protein
MFGMQKFCLTSQMSQPVLTHYHMLADSLFILHSAKQVLLSKSSNKQLIILDVTSQHVVPYAIATIILVKHKCSPSRTNHNSV